MCYLQTELQEYMYHNANFSSLPILNSLSMSNSFIEIKLLLYYLLYYILITIINYCNIAI